MLRGGALKKTTEKKKWVHLTCTLCISDVSIKDASTRLFIQIPKKLFCEKKNPVSFFCLFSVCQLVDLFLTTRTRVTLKKKKFFLN
jgi:hypothetical protein